MTPELLSLRESDSAPFSPQGARSRKTTPDERRHLRAVGPRDTRTIREPEGASSFAHRLHIQPFGLSRDLYVDGANRRVRRIKVLELAAILAVHPDGIDRVELQRHLLPDARPKNGGNHFRQIVHSFGITTGISLTRKQGTLVALPDDIEVDSADRRLEMQMTNSPRSVGDRLGRLQAALEPVSGAYLEGSDLPWVEERRIQLQVTEERARLELAELYIEQEEFDQARQSCEAVLRINRYCDPAYRMLVQIERATGTEASCLAVYRRAVNALRELGLRPGDGRRLFNLPPVSSPRSSSAVGPGESAQHANVASGPGIAKRSNTESRSAAAKKSPLLDCANSQGLSVFLVERYLPGLTGGQLRMIQRALGEAARQLAGEGEELEYVRTTYLPSSQRCFCVFRAAGVEVVERLNTVAQIPFTQIHEAVDIPGELQS
jgi:DNA-binding SARP family transcriptional activator